MVGQQLRPKGCLCRASTNECDLPEVCDGMSGQCPLNIYKKNGNLCEMNKGYCFNGICPTLDSQCQLIWGDGAFLSSSFVPVLFITSNDFLHYLGCSRIVS